MHVDRTQFAEVYEEVILQLDKLTPHQTERLKQLSCDEDTHIRAAAGAGKTFVALNHLIEMLSSGKRCLYVARNPALCYSVVKWIRKRKPESELSNHFLSKHLMLLFEPMFEGPRIVEIVDGKIETKIGANQAAGEEVRFESGYNYSGNDLCDFSDVDSEEAALAIFLEHPEADMYVYGVPGCGE